MNGIRLDMIRDFLGEGLMDIDEQLKKAQEQHNEAVRKWSGQK